MENFQRCEYFVLRYVPNLLREESVNFGVVMLNEPGQKHREIAQGKPFAEARFVSDWRRVQCLDANADIEMLQALEEDIRQKLAHAEDRDALMATLRQNLSGTIQISDGHACGAHSPQQEIARLAKELLESPPQSVARATRAARGRNAIFQHMRSAFTSAGVWDSMLHRIPVAPYTFKGDPLQIDCGYRPNGTMKFFHALSLLGEVDSAKALAFSYPRLAAGILRDQKVDTAFTAVVEDGLDEKKDAVAFAFETLQQSTIKVARVSEMPALAEVARQELRLV